MDAEAQPDLDGSTHMAARFMLQAHVSFPPFTTKGTKYPSLILTLTEVQYGILSYKVFTDQFCKIFVLVLTQVK